MSEKEMRFNTVLKDHGSLISHVCYIYADEVTAFDDLYQEVTINLWQNFESFRGEAKISTWLYRLALNTCLTTIRRQRNIKCHIPIDQMPDMAEDSGDRKGEISELYRIISRLEPVEKGIIMLWLDERPYDEIASITGISKANVAVKIHRIKTKLARFSKEEI